MSVKKKKKKSSSWGKLRLVFQCIWKIHYRFSADCNKWGTHNQSLVTFPHVCSFLWKYFSPFNFYWNLIFLWTHSCPKRTLKPFATLLSLSLAVWKAVLLAPNYSFQDIILFFSLQITHPPSQLLTMLPISPRKWKQLQGSFHALTHTLRWTANNICIIYFVFPPVLLKEVSAFTFYKKSLMYHSNQHQSRVLFLPF